MINQCFALQCNHPRSQCFSGQCDQIRCHREIIKKTKMKTKTKIWNIFTPSAFCKYHKYTYRRIFMCFDCHKSGMNNKAGAFKYPYLYCAHDSYIPRCMKCWQNYPNHSQQKQDFNLVRYFKYLEGLIFTGCYRKLCFDLVAIIVSYF